MRDWRVIIVFRRKYAYHLSVVGSCMSSTSLACNSLDKLNKLKESVYFGVLICIVMWFFISGILNSKLSGVVWVPFAVENFAL